jgi:acetyltransferase-like isoleucine patch superfamily enzyme
MGRGMKMRRGRHVGVDADRDVLLGYVGDRDVDGRLELGEAARLRSGTVLYAGSVIGARLQTGHHVVIREQCEIGDDVCLWSGTVVDYGCRIGNGVKIHSNCYVAQFTQIDDDAFLAPGVTIANDLYPGMPGSREAMSGPHIGAGARIGVNVTILPYVHIGAGALIGAGAVVTRDVPPGSLAYGTPAIARRTVDDLVPVAERVRPVYGSARRFQLQHDAASDSARPL